MMLRLQTGRPDEDRDIGRYGAVEARLQRGRRGEIDQHIAMVLVDRKSGVIAHRLGDGFAHPAVRSNQADADGLVGRAHGSLLSEAAPAGPARLPEP